MIHDEFSRGIRSPDAAAADADGDIVPLPGLQIVASSVQKGALVGVDDAAVPAVRATGRVTYDDLNRVVVAGVSQCRPGGSGGTGTGSVGVRTV